MSEHEHDPRPAQRGDFDQRARACYREAAATLPPSLQGRLRAARRAALQPGQAGGRAPHRWPVAMPAALTVAMAVALVLAIGLHGPRQPQDAPPQTEVAGTAAQDPRADGTGTPAPPAVEEAMDADPALVAASLADDVDTDELIYEHDPDFYLWLGDDDMLPATLEQDHDPT